MLANEIVENLEGGRKLREIIASLNGEKQQNNT